LDKEVDMSYRFYGVAMIAFSIAAGLVSTAIVALVTRAVRKFGQRERPSEAPNASERTGRGWAAVFTSRPVLIAFPVGFALAFYVILDRALSVSVYWQFVAPYAAFWLLVLLLLLWKAPARHKLLIVGSLAVVILGMRFVDWNSRKPFLRDLYRIKEGMTAAQVDQIMGDYMTCGAVSPGNPGIRLDGRLVEQGEQATGTISYRHTEEGWGNSDFGEVTFVSGRVVNVH
jgi:hypothetical protein